MMSVIDCRGNTVVNGDFVRSGSNKYRTMFTDGGIVLEESGTWVGPDNKTGKYTSLKTRPITIAFADFPNTRWHKV